MPARSFRLSLGLVVLAWSIGASAQDSAAEPEGSAKSASALLLRIDQRTEAQCSAHPEKCEELKAGGEKLKARCEGNPERCESRLSRALDKCDSDPEGCQEVWDRVLSRVD